MRFTSFFFLMIIFLPGMNLAQINTAPDSLNPTEIVDYDDPQTYEIGGIEVIGADYTDPNGIISVSGLNVGSTIKIPSEMISKAIRKLWKQGLFVDVNINIKNIVGDLVFLVINVKEYPRFARHYSKSGRRQQSHWNLANPWQLFAHHLKGRLNILPHRSLRGRAYPPTAPSSQSLSSKFLPQPSLLCCLDSMNRAPPGQG